MALELAARLERGEDRVEHGELLVAERLVRLVGRREVRGDALEPQVRQRGDASDLVDAPLVPQADAPHAGVDLDVHVERDARLGGRGAVGGRLVRRADERHEAVGDHGVHLVGQVGAERHDAHGAAGVVERGADLERLDHVGHAEEVDAFLDERAAGPLVAVAVGVGLDRGQDAGRVADESAHGAHVVAQGVEVDLGPRADQALVGARHGH